MSIFHLKGLFHNYRKDIRLESSPDSKSSLGLRQPVSWQTTKYLSPLRWSALRPWGWTPWWRRAESRQAALVGCVTLVSRWRVGDFLCDLVFPTLTFIWTCFLSCEIRERETVCLWFIPGAKLYDTSTIRVIYFLKSDFPPWWEILSPEKILWTWIPGLQELNGEFRHSSCSYLVTAISQEPLKD